MATINTAIERASKIRPDAFDDEIKASWISELDGKIMRETMRRTDFLPYEFPKDGNKPLAVTAPFDNIYELYIVAMCDFFCGELANYSASSALFERAYEEFRKDYIRNNMPPQSSVVL